MKWKAVPGFEGQYEVGSNGIVRGLDRKVTDIHGVVKSVRGKTLKMKINARGYYAVNLSKGGKDHGFVVHRLVAMAFIPNPEGLPQCNHLDGNKLNNDVTNLEWTTASGNVRHAYDTGLNPQCGCTHHLAVAVINLKTGEIWCTQKAAADDLQTNYPMFKNALNGRRPFPKDIDLDKYDFRKYNQGEC